VKLKAILKLSIKIGLTALALWVVFRKIDTRQTFEILLSANWFWLFAAVVLFNFSKILSSFRLNVFFKDTGLKLKEGYNLRLYYVGMFYNLFLPGGIGGDGYKVYLLNKEFAHPLKPLIKASLLDRFSGLIALLYLVIILAFEPLNFVVLSELGISWMAWLGLIILVPLWYLSIKKFFPDFFSSLNQTNLHSLGVQGFQIVCAMCILWSLGVHALIPQYILLFLISSVVAVLPFTIGGVGARELVFVLGHSFLGIDQNTAVAFSLLFFLITALSSLFGAFLNSKEA
jgi:glycosyltransferase 2 family protein